MKIRYIAWLLIFFVAQQVHGQEKKPVLDTTEAINLLYDYQAASKLKKLQNGVIDPAWESMFKDCFNDTVNVVFDIPVRQGDDLIPEYQKYVTLNRYIELVRDIYFQDPILTEINYDFIILGNDFSAPDSANQIIYEVEKRFANTKCIKAESQRYLFEIQNLKGEPKITQIRISSTGITRKKVKLQFMPSEAKDKKNKKENDLSMELFTTLKIDYDEDVYDRTIHAQTDSKGMLTVGQISTRARIIVENVHGLNDEKFTLPLEWQTDGKLVSRQPDGGFKITARPYQWNGWTTTVKVSGGGVIPYRVNTSNFITDNTDFDRNPGFLVGIGASITKFFNTDRWRNKKHNWIFGLGSGASFHYVRYKVKSTHFEQTPFSGSDRAGDDCVVLISGINYQETLWAVLLKIPLYAEARKKVKYKCLKSFSVQAGANLMIPISSRFKYKGTLSRHGQYPDFENQIIKEEPFYYYYTNQQREQVASINYNNFMVEGMVRLNFFCQKKENNSWVFALESTVPFLAMKDNNTSEFRINSGDNREQFRSTAFALENLYKFYMGISIGWNFIKYRPQ